MAIERDDSLLEVGNMADQAARRRVLKAIAKILREEPRHGQAAN